MLQTVKQEERKKERKNGNEDGSIQGRNEGRKKERHKGVASKEGSQKERKKQTKYTELLMGIIMTGRMCEKVHRLLAVGRWFPPGTPVSSTRELISSSFHRLDMTLAVNPNKPNQTIIMLGRGFQEIKISEIHPITGHNIQLPNICGSS